VIGAGWAGCAAAVAACRAGRQVTLFEASHHPGGRARRLEGVMRTNAVDNGQHILIGAYTETLALMQSLDVDPDSMCLRTPLHLTGLDGHGLRLPASRRVPPALGVAAGILCHKGWSLSERLRLLAAALGWQARQFRCADHLSVAELCQPLPERIRQELLTPLCVSALNTPPHRASARVFLRVLQDALLAAPGSADVLIPTSDLSALLPAPAIAWLRREGASVRLGQRVRSLHRVGDRWQIDAQESALFDAVILATPHRDATRLLRSLAAPASAALQLQQWVECADALACEAIATLYLRADTPTGRATLPQPMMRMAGEPAQFVFDRGQLGNSPGTLALVCSAPDARWPDRQALEQAALAQARGELAALGIDRLTLLQTVVEKRATFACTPGLRRPDLQVAEDLPGLLACGDYVEGPYPATLEGAVRSGLAAAAML
jgi:hydroxysqualene dehydroxylase